MHTNRPSGVRVIGGLSAVSFAAIATLHFVWLRNPWPLRNWSEWSHAFGGENFRVRDDVMTAVALLFLAAGYIVAVLTALLPRIGPAWLYRRCAWGIAFILTVRALLGFAEMLRTFLNPLTPPPFRETILLYLTIYLPLFLLLGLATAYVALRARTPT